MAKIEQKVKANPYHFGRFWPLFQLFKNGSKTKAIPFRIIFNHSQRGFSSFWTVFKKLKKMAKIEQKVKANPLPFWSILATFSTF